MIWLHALIKLVTFGLIGAVGGFAVAWPLARRELKRWRRVGLLQAASIITDQKLFLVREQNFPAAQWADFHLAAILTAYLQEASEQERAEMLGHFSENVAAMVRSGLAEQAAP